jgi:hypothetical protein
METRIGLFFSLYQAHTAYIYPTPPVPAKGEPSITTTFEEPFLYSGWHTQGKRYSYSQRPNTMSRHGRLSFLFLNHLLSFCDIDLHTLGTETFLLSLRESPGV